MYWVELLVLEPVADGDLGRMTAIDPRVHVVDARSWFDAEIRETTPAWICRYLGDRFLGSAGIVFRLWR